MTKEDINNIIIKSNRNLTTTLLKMVEIGKTTKLKFKFPNDIYTGRYDKMYHFCITSSANWQLELGNFGAMSIF